ncbi:hypothetical protein BGZ68_008561 [Mortierella alpina]|nr:hypothetical protein BGZ68_008561 [Mortierella alpina]
MRIKWASLTIVASIANSALFNAVQALPGGMIACLENIESNSNPSLITPSSPDYNIQRFDYDRNFDYQPIAIYYPATNADVAAAVRCAAAYGISVAPRSGGHSYEGYSVGGRDGSLVIDLKHFQQFSMNNVSNVATIGAGTRLGPLYSKLWNAGQYLVASGVCPIVGIGGIALGGGVGMASRKYGTTTQNIVGMTLVDADGNIREVSASSNPDLFWALRGAGGGSFGLVTEFRIQAYKAPLTMMMMNLTYPLSEYRNVIHAFGTWADAVTDDMYAGLVIDRGNINLRATFLGPLAPAQVAFAPFLSLAGEPQRYDTFELSWYEAATAVGRKHGGTLESPDLSRYRYHRGRSLVYRKPMSFEEMDTIYKYLHDIPAPKGSTRTYVAFEMWGGKINRADALPSAFDNHRGATYSVQFGVWWNVPDVALGSGCLECMQWSTRFSREMQAAYSSGPFLEAYQNYMERDFPNAMHAYYGNNLPRLQRIKESVDPHNVFSFPQSIPLPESSKTRKHVVFQ